jgi:c-di-GMP-binding flagellar brake protein YcgR
MAERRRSVRHKAFLKGNLYFNDGRSSIDCLIRDFSATGARLLVPDALKLPRRLALHMPNRSEPVCVRVKWRRHDEVGVSFVAAQRRGRNAARPDELERRMAALERQIAALRKLLAQSRGRRSRSARRRAA